MKRFILTCLCNGVLLLALCLPAEARIIIGLTPVAPLAGIDQTLLDHLGDELTSSSGTTVKVRKLDNEATLANWLLRFQEIDAAITTPGFIRHQPAGTLAHLADLHSKSDPSHPLALIARSNLNNNQGILLKEAFSKLGTSDRGQKLLAKLGLAGVTAPGEILKFKAVKPAPRVKPEKIHTTPAPTAKESPKPKDKTFDLKKKPVTPSEPKTSVISSPKIPAEPAPQKQQQKQVVATPVKESLPPVKKEKQPEEVKTTKKKPLASAPQPQAKTPSNKRLVLFTALLLFVIIILKILLITMRWKNKRQSTFQQEEAPEIGNSLENEKRIDTPVPPGSLVVKEDQAIETGQLGPGKVPALLKRCANLPAPVVMQVTKGSCKKLIYFAGGQVSGALSQNATSPESELSWNKLGNLMIREELISSGARDQAMALLGENPKLRFGEALLKLGLIDLNGLRHALTRQAKVTIYSLILFPEGSYQVFAGEGSLSPEESVSIEITSLMQEASQHQTEWTAIRQALPNLSTALNFTAEGQSKLENVGLSPQQEEILALIDGKLSINDLCVESVMMDYEVYRFLYLMVKAGVLK